jgi:alkanesulfonate monooxygenase SsuD/methylene tetrahydromethanopterin reductase-like flavin-dependent oxidoreductase (luciferase family)
MAAVTEHLEFTTGVYIAPARDLITVAKQVGTAAVVSSGRVALGIGVGWCEEEFVATGQDFHTRGKRLDDMIPALRALWAGGWVEYHGPHYDVPAMRMEPSPPGPIPIICGGHSAPAFRRAAALCDGWVAAGAYKPDQARTYLGELAEQRRRAGRESEPFSIYLSLWARPDADLYRSFEEDFGVTDLLCAPAMVAKVDPSDSPEAQLQTRLDASARFADEILAKMA